MSKLLKKQEEIIKEKKVTNHPIKKNFPKIINKNIIKKKPLFLKKKLVEKFTCVCTERFEPVCGTDNITYHNYCRLLCEKKSRKFFKKFGVC